MKFFFIIVLFIVSGYFAFQQFKPKPAPPPPPPPPAIILEPAPIITESEQAKVIRSAGDQDPEVRWQAIVFLDKVKSPQAYPVIFDRLHKDTEPALRMRIVEMLGQRKGPDISQHLVLSLKDHEPEVRVSVLKALDSVGDYATASAITECLRDQEESVRTEALRTLNSLQDKKAAELEAERKRQEELRRQAEEAAKKGR